ncbi:related to RRP3 - protein involved in rRNA processing [Ustilago trichophora]|uniref:RNA helicase n=1 Tax=Ustilago trichophora TaxID=86804 RepID=A0A5C3E2V9_9BASI|nr:related to RRP3 - protein involved in rRNA processing [Ustilago trichophora]
MLRVASGASKQVETLLSRPLHHHKIRSGSSLNARHCFHSLSQHNGKARPRPLTFASCLASTTCSIPPTCSQHCIRPIASAHRSFYSTLPSSTSANEEAELDVGATPQSGKANTEGVQEKFQRLGLNANISRQITVTHPHIRQPTPAQSALIPAILSPTDVILRAHTGTGKSFGILLALLSKPRIVFRDQTASDAESSSVSRSRRNKPRTGIASIILVPSNELAFQYLRWARSLFPASSLPSMDPVMQCLVRGGLPGAEALTPEQELKRLKATPPHILIGTPGRIKDILDTPAGSSLLGLDTLRTLVLDEADAVLQLPGRFPSQKQRWKHEVHKAPGLLVLNAIMKRRATYSGGEKHLSAGLENRPGKRRDEKRPPEHVRRNTYKAAERSSANQTDPNAGLALPKSRGADVYPLQLVATSATANSVMRHFFGARTGWLRTGAKESGLTFAPQVGRWIDLTGLSGKSMVDQGIRGLFGANERWRTTSLIQTSLDQTPSTMPASITHTCVVVDEAPLSKQLAAVPLRNFEPKLARKKSDSALVAPTASGQPAESFDSALVGDDFMVVKAGEEVPEHEMDQTLIEALAFCFASEGVDRGLALIPARWSLLKTRAALENLGVTVRLASDVSSGLIETAIGSPSEGPELFLLQTTSSRGLDIPALSHVFLTGYASVIDAVQYVHAAGRVARIGGDPDAPATGKVVTLLRGLPHDTPLPTILQRHQTHQNSDKRKKAISTSEAKMANVYRRLGVVPKKFDLGLLTTGAAAAPAISTRMEEADLITGISHSESFIAEDGTAGAEKAEAGETIEKQKPTSSVSS